MAIVRKRRETDVDPSLIFSLNLKILQIGAVWWRDIQGEGWKITLYRVYQYLMILLRIFLGCGIHLNAIFVRENFEHYSESLVVSLLEFVHEIKTVPFFFLRKELTALTVSLENNFYIHGKLLTNEEKNVVKKAMSLAKAITICYFGSLCITSSIMVSTPAMVLFTSRSSNISESEDYSLQVWKTWYPFDANQYPYNILVYVQQIIATMSIGIFFIGGINAFYIVLIVYTTSQYELLSVSLRNTRENILTQIKESNRTKKLGSTDYMQKTTLYVKECIQYHQNLLKRTDDLNRMLSPMMFLQLLTASVTTCMLGFQLILMSPNNMKFFKIFSHLVTAVFELGLFCWFGSKLIVQSVDVHNAAYESGWYDMAPDAKKYIHMIIMRAQKPVALTTGKFGLLSMPLFAELMKASYTYLTMLRQLMEDEGK